MKIYQVVTSALGPGETIGSADPKFDVDYRLEAASYDGFETVTGALAVSARRVKTRSKIITSTGVAYIKFFQPTIDITERTESGTVVGPISTGGTTVAFASPFNSAPIPKTVNYIGPNPRVGIASSVTTTQFTLTVYQISDGADVGLVSGESVEWEVIGA